MAPVLLVDDDQDIRETIAEVLEEYGFSCRTAAHGEQALELLRGDLAPCLILLDLSMPVMNGAQFRAEQLRDPELARIPTVALSATGSLRDKSAGLQFAEALKKPVELADLLRVVSRYAVPSQPDSR